MRAYSRDLRQRILAAVDDGASQRTVAERFGVDVRTVRRYLAKRRATGSIDPEKNPGGRPSRIRPEQQPLLMAQLRLHPTATLSELCERWERITGTRLSEATMSRTLRRLGWRWKRGRWSMSRQAHAHSGAGASGSRNSTNLARR
jgi:transposase